MVYRLKGTMLNRAVGIIDNDGIVSVIGNTRENG